MPKASLLFTWRITVDGVRIEVSSKRYVNPDKWNTNGQKLTGNSEDIKNINANLKTLEHRVGFSISAIGGTCCVEDNWYR